MDVLVECKGLKKSYGKIPVIKELDLSLERGRIIGILGPNGSGKTTLIKILAGILNKNDGEVTISGKSIGIETKKIVSYLPERTYFSPNMRVKDTINFLRIFMKISEETGLNRCLKALIFQRIQKLNSFQKEQGRKCSLFLL